MIWAFAVFVFLLLTYVLVAAVALEREVERSLNKLEHYKRPKISDMRAKNILQNTPKNATIETKVLQFRRPVEKDKR